MVIFSVILSAIHTATAPLAFNLTPLATDEEENFTMYCTVHDSRAVGEVWVVYNDVTLPDYCDSQACGEGFQHNATHYWLTVADLKRANTGSYGCTVSWSGSNTNVTSPSQAILVRPLGPLPVDLFFVVDDNADAVTSNGFLQAQLMMTYLVQQLRPKIADAAAPSRGAVARCGTTIQLEYNLDTHATEYWTLVGIGNLQHRSGQTACNATAVYEYALENVFNDGSTSRRVLFFISTGIFKDGEVSSTRIKEALKLQRTGAEIYTIDAGGNTDIPSDFLELVSVPTENYFFISLGYDGLLATAPVVKRQLNKGESSAWF